MEQMYYLWSAAMQGWALHGGGYGTELKDAKQFPKHDALARCILHFRKSEDLYGLLPISTGDLAEIKGDA
jgi:hypothetical protein